VNARGTIGIKYATGCTSLLTSIETSCIIELKRWRARLTVSLTGASGASRSANSAYIIIDKVSTYTCLTIIGVVTNLTSIYASLTLSIS